MKTPTHRRKPAKRASRHTAPRHTGSPRAKGARPPARALFATTSDGARVDVTGLRAVDAETFHQFVHRTRTRWMPTELDYDRGADTALQQLATDAGGFSPGARIAVRGMETEGTRRVPVWRVVTVRSPSRENPDRSDFNRANALRWMRAHREEYREHGTGESNPTGLAEACAAEFGVDGVRGPLDDSDHWIWEIAVEAYPENAPRRASTRKNLSTKPARRAGTARNLRPNPGLLYVTVSDHAGDTKSVNGAQLAIDVRSFERAMGSSAARWVSPDRDGDLASAKLSKQAKRLSSIERGAMVYVRGKHIEGTAPRWHRVTVL